jgi:CheY-like chemotaxis protein
MWNDKTAMVHIPLSRYVIGELYVRASELRSMAGTARCEADNQALIALSRRFNALAERREALERDANEAAEAFALRMTQTERPAARDGAAPDRSSMAMGQPSAEALQTATDAVGRYCILPETMEHPVIRSACTRLAYHLMAYGLVPTGQDAAVVATARRRENSVGLHRTPTHILVVDDVADVLVTVGAFLLSAGFTVGMASTGDEALKMIANDPRIEVLITDFAMPGLSGADLILQAAQARPKLKALVITGYPGADGLAELPSQTTILVKPFRRDSLVAALTSLLGEAVFVPREAADLLEQRQFDHRQG